MLKWFETAKRLGRFGRAERALTLVIFLLFQAMLPSYAAAISEASANDQLVLCTEHGLMVLPGDELPLAADEQNSICLIAQSLSAQLGEVPVLPQLLTPLLMGKVVSMGQIAVFQTSVETASHAPRAPPSYS